MGASRAVRGNCRFDHPYISCCCCFYIHRYTLYYTHMGTSIYSFPLYFSSLLEKGTHNSICSLTSLMKISRSIRDLSQLWSLKIIPFLMLHSKKFLIVLLCPQLNPLNRHGKNLTLKNRHVNEKVVLTTKQTLLHKHSTTVQKYRFLVSKYSFQLLLALLLVLLIPKITHSIQSPLQYW